MKKRIVSFLLVIALTLLALCSCAYNYEKANLDVTYDKNAFADALKNIDVSDLDYNPAAGNRDAQVLKSLNSKFASYASDKATAYTTAQKAVFNYYLTFALTEDGAAVTHTVVENMKKDNRITMNLWDAGEDGSLTKALADAIAVLSDKTVSLAECLYDSEVEAGSVAYITYDGQTQLTAVTVPAPAEGESAVTDASLGDQLRGKAVGSVVETISVGSGETAVTYNNVKVHFICKTELPEITFTYQYADAKSFKDTEGKTVAVPKDTLLTVHAVATEVYDVKAYLADMNATNEDAFRLIVERIFGESVTTESLAVFADKEHHPADDASKTVSAVIANIKTLKDRVDALSDSAKTEAQKQLDDAVKTLPDDLLKFKSETFDIVKLVVDQYRATVAKDLMKTYKSEIKDVVAKKVLAEIEAIKVNAVDEKAIKEATDRLFEQHKYNYYTDTKITGNKTNAGMKSYIIKQYEGATTYADAQKAMRAAAEKEVKFLMQIYAVARDLGLAKVGSDQMKVYDFSNITGNASVMEYFKALENNARTAYGDTNVKAKVVFDRVMDYFLEAEGETGTDDASEIRFIHVSVKQ